MLWTRLAPRAARGRRHADGHRRGQLGGRARSAVPEHRSEGHRARPARARPQRPRRGGRSRARPRVLVSLPRGRRGQPDRPHEDRAAGRRARSTRLRFGVCGCSHYETGYFTAFRRIADEHFDFVFHTGDYIYEGRADGGRSDRVRQHNGDRDLHARRLPEPLRALQVRSRPDGGARLGALRR